MQINFDASKVVQGWKPEQDFSVSVSVVTQPTGTYTTDLATIKDCTYVRDTYSGSITTGAVAVSNIPTNPAVWYESMTPTVCTITHDTGIITALAGGTGIIRVHGQTGYREVTVDNLVAGSSVSYPSITSVAAGSLRKYLLEQQAAALAGVTPGLAAQCAYANTTDYSGGINAGCFIRAQGKSGFAGLPLDLLDQMLLSTDFLRNKVWLTPHHYITGIGSTHGTQPDTGHSYKLVGTDTVVWYSVTSWAGSLARLLPATYKTQMPDVLTSASETPCFARLYHVYDSAHPNYHGFVQPVAFSSGSLGYPRSSGNPYLVGDYRRAYQAYNTGAGSPMVNPGDSGSPIFFGIGGIFVIYSFVSTADSMGTDDLALLGSAINTAMNQLATANSDGNTYAALTADLSSFSTY